MNKTVYIVCECDTYGRIRPGIAGVFDSLDTAITSIIDNGGYSEDELNCVGDMRQYLAEHRCTPQPEMELLNTGVRNERMDITKTNE